MALSRHLRPLFEALKEAHPDGLSLDELGEELLRKPVTFADIEELIGALEEAGFDLESTGPPGRPDELGRVLTAARALASETGQRPTVTAISERAGLSPIVVRRALRLGSASGHAGPLDS
jgi:hypothetical protein